MPMEIMSTKKVITAYETRERESNKVSVAFEAFLSTVQPAPANPAKMHKGKIKRLFVNVSNALEGNNWLRLSIIPIFSISRVPSTNIGIREGFLIRTVNKPVTARRIEDIIIITVVETPRRKRLLLSLSSYTAMVKLKKRTGYSAYLPN